MRRDGRRWERLVLGPIYHRSAATSSSSLKSSQLESSQVTSSQAIPSRRCHVIELAMPRSAHHVVASTCRLHLHPRTCSTHTHTSGKRETLTHGGRLMRDSCAGGRLLRTVGDSCARWETLAWEEGLEHARPWSSQVTPSQGTPSQGTASRLVERTAVLAVAPRRASAREARSGALDARARMPAPILHIASHCEKSVRTL
jgi:hypothetical protein